MNLSKKLSTQHKATLSLALAVCLCAPMSVYAANSGGTNVPTNDYYTGVYKEGQNEAANGANVFIDTPITGTINGGWSKNGDANGNTVTVDLNTNSINAPIAGGTSNTGAANGNIVTIKSGIFDNKIYGGNGKTESSNNQVIIEDGTFNSNIYVGYSKVSATANGNKLIISGGTQSFIDCASTEGEANNNSITISGGTQTQTIRSGRAVNGSANNNSITISGGTQKSVITVGDSALGAAHNNSITISGGTQESSIIGGKAGTIANNNSITISGGTQKSSIIGGSTYSGTASNNTVTIEGTANLESTVGLYGGQGPTSTGNRLNIYKHSVYVDKVDKFQKYDLAIAPGETTLKVIKDLTLGTEVTITSTRVLSEMNVGDTVTLLASDGTLTNNATLDDSNKARQGILYKYGYELVKDDVNNTVVANIISKEKNTQATSVADGQLAAMGMLRSGADLVASAAMDNAAKANTEYDTFAVMNYTNISMNSVSSIDVQGSSMLVGMGRNIAHDNSNLTIGAFLEAGWGTYESSLGLAHAKGHTNYYGVGLLARNNANSGLYTEGSLRVGKVGNTYSGRTIEDGTYDVSSTYYGLHLGIGKINKINETISTDIYAKYFYAHEGGTDANIAGDNFNFDSIDSHRVRIGGRLNSLNKNINRYVGLAYEYEFSGKATASVHGSELAAPTAKGSSGILELGLVYKPTTDSKFSMDMGMNGYVGKRKGVTGNVTLNWGF